LIVCSGLNDVDLGLVGDQTLAYLANILENDHKLSNIGFG
jgi:hypothetical protein